jgi:soluble lytic murein transglycosylase
MGIAVADCSSSACVIARQRGVRKRSRVIAFLLASAVGVLGVAEAFAATKHKAAPSHSGKLPEAQSNKHAAAPDARRRAAESDRNLRYAIPLPRERPPEADQVIAQLPPDLALAKQAIDLVRQHRPDEAIKLAASSTDPVAPKLVEWVLLRNAESAAGFDRYAAFIRANPEWPSIPLLRRRAEARLWQERRQAATLRGFLDGEPTSAVGRLALARVLMNEGDRAGAQREVRELWRSMALSPELEGAVIDTFGGELTAADHAARMDRRIGAKDFGTAMRAAKRLGDADVAIVKACSAAEAKSDKAAALLEAVPGEARSDLGYALCRLHWLLRKDDIAAASKLVLSVAHENLPQQDTNEWWREIRLLARRLIDAGDAKTAYQVACGAALPANPYYRAEFHFMAGWIALRFLDDPVTSLEHFSHVDDGSADPIVLARAAYWRVRAAEAAGQGIQMRAQYEAAARYPTAYYGQLARVRLGLPEVALRSPPPSESMNSIAQELVHAADILYGIGERDLALSFVSDLAEESSNAPALAALAELTARYNDARAMLLIGKTALSRGLPMDKYAFPDFGVPAYKPVGPQLDPSIVYAIVRTESAFDPHDLSPAKAVGLMQVTPEAGRDTAKRFGVVYDWTRLVSDQAYNTEMGAAEVTALFKEYRGSYIMTFAGYNAGRGRVKEWVAKHGDPRDPKVDAVDWVERIPIAETRNYVQRVMENLQIYGVRFGGSIVTVEPNLHRGAGVEVHAEPASLKQSISDAPSGAAK